jgi:hypothetical protein
MLRPKMSLALAFAALAAMAGSRFMEGKRTLRSMGLSDSAEAIPASRNHGHKAGSGNRVYQRAALKKRNQARHRRSCRG